LQRKTRLIAAMPADIRDQVSATLELETEPLTIELQENAYTEMILRQRINEAAKSNLLAYAEKEDLDNKAADYDVARLLITQADPDAVPPVEAVWESDDRLRLRTRWRWKAPRSQAAAAPTCSTPCPHRPTSLTPSSTRAHRPLRGDSPAPGEIHVWVLDTRGDGVPDAALLNTVGTALSAETVRPLNDTVVMRAAQPDAFTISALIEFEEGGEALSGGLDGARTRLNTLLAKAKKLGTGQKPSGLPTSALIAAIKVDGVHDVQLLSPLRTIAADTGQFPLCTGITVDKAP
jgi:phage-related baseplate assembly protein